MLAEFSGQAAPVAIRGASDRPARESRTISRDFGHHVEKENQNLGQSSGIINDLGAISERFFTTL